METELNAICKDILTLLDESLITKAGPAEPAVFYQKMMADYYRYLAEFSTGELAAGLNPNPAPRRNAATPRRAHTAPLFLDPARRDQRGARAVRGDGLRKSHRGGVRPRPHPPHPAGTRSQLLSVHVRRAGGEAPSSERHGLTAPASLG